jgi:DNA-binding transcriptional ArsR family regulator
MKEANGHAPSAGHAQQGKSLTGEVIDMTAQRLRIMAEPNRIALLEVLNRGEAGVQSLADEVGLPHQNVSQHLGILHKAGLVSRRREGAMSLYAISDWSAWWVIEQIARWVESCQDEQGASAPIE